MKNLKNLFFFVLAISVLASCGQDDEGATSSPIIGAWSFNSVSITDISIDGEDFETYLEGLGMSDEDIAEMMATMEATVEGDFEFEDMVIEFSSDNTYLVTQPGEENETGTWALSEDGKTLTIDEEEFEVKTLTSSSLVVTQTHEETSEEGEFSATVELAFTK